MSENPENEMTDEVFRAWIGWVESLGRTICWDCEKPLPIDKQRIVIRDGKPVNVCPGGCHRGEPKGPSVRVK